MEKSSSFFALVFRQKYIRRWGLMHSFIPENLAEHSSECAVIAHALAEIGNRFYGKNYDVGRAVTMALFHDVPEVFTGDMPTPVKYAGPAIRNEFAVIEEQSVRALIAKLPEELRDIYAPLFDEEDDKELRALVKSADRLCAYIKCTEEEKLNNTEFSRAKEGIEKRLAETDSPELRYFIEHFLPAFGATLDEQQEG